MKDDRSEDKKSAAEAISEVWPMRPIGTIKSLACRWSAVKIDSSRGVKIVPGAIALERI